MSYGIECVCGGQGKGTICTCPKSYVRMMYEHNPRRVVEPAPIAKFNPAITINRANVLECPRCNSNCLHQDRVEVFVRHEEDGGGTCVIVEDSKKVEVQSRSSKNMGGGRRDNIYIHFSCEECDSGEDEKDNLVLHIQQHKGQTFIQWVQ